MQETFELQEETVCITQEQGYEIIALLEELLATNQGILSTVLFFITLLILVSIYKWIIGMIDPN